MVWQKGESGNPGGRSKGIERVFREYLQAPDDSRDAVDGETRLDRVKRFLYGAVVTDGVKSADRLAAAKLLLERAYGQPKVAIEVTPPLDDADDLSGLSDAELVALEAHEAAALAILAARRPAIDVASAEAAPATAPSDES